MRHIKKQPSYGSADRLPFAAPVMSATEDLSNAGSRHRHLTVTKQNFRSRNNAHGLGCGFQPQWPRGSVAHCVHTPLRLEAAAKQ